MASAFGQITGNAFNDTNAILSVISSAAVDVVGIYDSNFNQLFVNVRPLTAKVNERAKFPEHPLESGAVMSDHRIIQPIEITLNMIFTGDTYADDYNTIKTYFESNNSLTVQTRTGVYQNMFIIELPHDESAELYDTIKMVLQLRQVQIVQAKAVALTKSTANSPTVSTGAQQGTTQTAPAGSGNTGSAAYAWFSGGAAGK